MVTKYLVFVIWGRSYTTGGEKNLLLPSAAPPYRATNGKNSCNDLVHKWMFFYIKIVKKQILPVNFEFSFIFILLRWFGLPLNSKCRICFLKIAETALLPLTTTIKRLRLKSIFGKYGGPARERAFCEGSFRKR
jgi:hypothetical protein